MTYLSTTYSGATENDMLNDIFTELDTLISAHASWTKQTTPTTNGSGWAAGDRHEVYENVTHGFFLYLRLDAANFYASLAEEYDGTVGAETFSKVIKNQENASTTPDANGYLVPGPIAISDAGFLGSNDYAELCLNDVHLQAGGGDSSVLELRASLTERMLCVKVGANVDGITPDMMFAAGLGEDSYPNQSVNLKTLCLISFDTMDEQYGTMHTNRLQDTGGTSQYRAGGVALNHGGAAAALRDNELGEVAGAAGPLGDVVMARIAMYSQLQPRNLGLISPTIVSIEANLAQVVVGDTISVHGGTDNMFYAGQITNGTNNDAYRTMQLWWLDADPELI